MAEQRYQAVLAVIAEGSTVTEVAGRCGVSRQSVPTWLARYERSGLEGLTDRSRRPGCCPHQMDPRVEAVVLEMRRVHRSAIVRASTVFRNLTKSGRADAQAA